MPVKLQNVKTRKERGACPLVKRIKFVLNFYEKLKQAHDLGFF